MGAAVAAVNGYVSLAGGGACGGNNAGDVQMAVAAGHPVGVAVAAVSAVKKQIR
jgi:hypothetical protein